MPNHKNSFCKLQEIISAPGKWEKGQHANILYTGRAENKTPCCLGNCFSAHKTGVGMLGSNSEPLLPPRAHSSACKLKRRGDDEGIHQYRARDLDNLYPANQPIIHQNMVDKDEYCYLMEHILIVKYYGKRLT